MVVRMLDRHGEVWVNMNDLILAISEAQKPKRPAVVAIIEELKRLKESYLNGCSCIR
jgi:hypothetical protein